MTEASNSQKTVLLVDDDGVILSQYQQMLEIAGYNVLIAINGAVAFDILSEKKGKIDLVLLDLMMPGFSGTEVLLTVKKDPKKYGNPKIVILTNLTNDMTIKESFNLGADGFIVKTEVEMDSLIKEIKKVLG